MIAFAEVPPLFVTLASGLFLAGLGQAYFFSIEAVPWPDALDGLIFLGRGSLFGVPASVWMFLAMFALTWLS